MLICCFKKQQWQCFEKKRLILKKMTTKCATECTILWDEVKSICIFVCWEKCFLICFSEN